MSEPNRTIRRLERILDVVPYLAARPGVEIDTVCGHFDIDRRTFLADLDLLYLCGLPPYSPGDLFEVDIDDDCVWLSGVDSLTRPFGLRREDATRLLAGARLALALPGVDPVSDLASAADKLEGALGEETLDVTTEEQDDRLTVLRRAVVDDRLVRIRYWSMSSDTESWRQIEPERLFAADGNWYLSAWCRAADGPRTFRVDRMREVEITDEVFEAAQGRDRPAVERGFGYRAGESDLRVTVDLGPDARWVVERWPVESREDRGHGVLRIVLAAPSETVLLPLLLQLGPDANVVDPAWVAERRSAAAAGVRARYDEVGDHRPSPPLDP